MKKRVKVSLITLTILFVISFFEIFNVEEYYSDQSWGETGIELSKHSKKEKAIELQQLHNELQVTQNCQYLMEFLSVGFVLAFVVIFCRCDKEYQIDNKSF